MWWVSKDRRPRGHRKAGSEKRRKVFQGRRNSTGHGMGSQTLSKSSQVLSWICLAVWSVALLQLYPYPAGLLHSSWGWKEQSQFLGNGNHTPRERGEWFMECTHVDISLLSELIPSTECDSQCVVTGHITLETSLNSAESASTLNWDSIAGPLFGN